jgi:hypothetical protein
MHPGCTFSNDKPYALKRHFEGSVAKKTHTRQDWENSIGDTNAVEPTTISVASSSATEAPEKPPVQTSKPSPDTVTPPPPAPTSTPMVNLSAGDIEQIVAALAKQILSDTDVRLDFVQTMAIEAASYPHSAFCKEPDALVRSMDGGMRLWRSTMVNDTGSGLVELLITKHIFLFKNLKPSYEDDHVSVYRGGKVWVSVSHHEAAVAMLQRAEHDMLSLYEAHTTSTDSSYKKYRSQMQRFLTNVGCKLGWDHTPYEIDPESVYTEAFYESIIKSIIYSVKQTLSS